MRNMSLGSLSVDDITLKIYTGNLIESDIAQSLFSIIQNNMQKIMPSDECIKSIYSQWYKNCVVDFCMVKKGTTIVAFEGNKVCGYLQFLQEKNNVVWAEMQISEEHQGDGLTFRSLIKQYLQSDEIKDKDILGYINDKNYKSKAVFSKLGFCPIYDTHSGKKYLCKFSDLILFASKLSDLFP